MNEQEQKIVDDFHNLFYEHVPLCPRTNSTLKWLGVPIVKSPLDTFSFQEVIQETFPTLIIETGTAYGGSANFFARTFPHLRVLTIDNKDVPDLEHERILTLRGDSLSPETIKAAKQRAGGQRVMVVLDSDHTARHVYGEMKTYGPLVTSGCYMVVEDSNLGGNPIHHRFAPSGDRYDRKGPAEAVRKFQEEHSGMFEIDHERAEKFLFSMNTWMRRL